MFCSKKTLHRLNDMYERSLCLIHQDYVSNFIILFCSVNTNEKSIQQKCLEFLMMEVYKYFNGLSPQLMNGIFKLRKNVENVRNVHFI